MQVIQRNVAGQSVDMLAIDTATGGPKTGDAWNITIYLEKDKDGTLSALSTGVEISATNKPGIYRYSLSQAYSDAREIGLTGKSSTSGVIVVPLTIQTVGPNVMQDLWDYLAETPWNLHAVMNRLRYGIPAVLVKDKQGYELTSEALDEIALAIHAKLKALEADPIPVNVEQMNKHPVAGDGSVGNPIVVTP
jgi:hypothetical protein